jgi:CubicO group peptidase (beta-lactamase class C family)
MTIPDRIAAALSDLRLAPRQLEGPVTLEELMRKSDIPGVGLAVVTDSRVEWAGGFGVRSAGAPDPVTAGTLFQAGSISKPVAALCALRLVAAGHLELDDDVNDHLTSWSTPDSAGWSPRITLRQLLSHTAGLTVHGFPGYSRDRPAPNLVEVLGGRGNTPPVVVRSVPGLEFSYSGGGYCVLQQLLVDTTGQPFPELAHELVFEPLGMADSTYEQPLSETWQPRAATGHRTGGRPVDGDWHVYPEMAAAGLWTTPSDLGRVVVAIQQGKRGLEEPFLPQDLIDELLTSHARNVSWGLGFGVENEGSALRFHHGGDDQGFVAWLEGYAEAGFGAVAMTNSDDGDRVLAPLVTALARAHGWPHYPGSAEPELRQTSIREVDACVGTYESVGGYRLGLERAGDDLVLVVSGQAPITLASASATEWHALPLAATITVDLDDSGRGTALRLRQAAAYVSDVDARRVD